MQTFRPGLLRRIHNPLTLCFRGDAILETPRTWRKGTASRWDKIWFCYARTADKYIRLFCVGCFAGLLGGCRFKRI